MSRAEEIINELYNLNEEINSLHTEYSNKVSIADKELTDIYNYIEFNDLSASDGYKAYKDLQRCLKNRREVKNEQSLLNSIMNSGMEDVVINSVKNLESVRSKVYTPRIRNDLFENGTEDATEVVIRAFDSKKGVILKDFNSMGDAVKYLKNKNPLGFHKCKNETISKNIQNAIENNTSYNNITWVKTNKIKTA